MKKYQNKTPEEVIKMVTIEIIELLSVDDHILVDEKQHWVSPTYIAKSVGNAPQILEPHKCLRLKEYYSVRAMASSAKSQHIADENTNLFFRANNKDKSQGYTPLAIWIEFR